MARPVIVIPKCHFTCCTRVPQNRVYAVRERITVYSTETRLTPLLMTVVVGRFKTFCTLCVIPRKKFKQIVVCRRVDYTTIRILVGPNTLLRGFVIPCLVLSRTTFDRLCLHARRVIDKEIGMISQHLTPNRFFVSESTDTDRTKSFEPI